MGDNAMKEEVEEIAIVGMAGRFPGAGDVAQFWRNLRDGVESVSFYADEEVEASPLNPAAAGGANYVKAGGVLEGVEMFDAPFFGFTPREAEITDPQQRVFLECAWEALESSGHDAESFKGRVGVYAGSGLNTYWLRFYTQHGLPESFDPLQVVIGNEKDHLSTRASYKLNLRGPSINVQTTCSSSLVAVSLACQSLLNYECDMALAGGVSIRVPQKQGYFYREGGILSPDGHCRAFDAEARGTVGGSGAGVVVLRRLSDALDDGDHIRAVIKGAAVNNDGAAKVGYTAPGVEGQAAVIAEALAVAGLGPEAISYVEAHGTATPLGDPVEVAALSKVFGAARGRKNSCAIGSVKTNVGHLDAAAGVAGLIKTVLSLEHAELPPSLHFKRANPKIDFEGGPFYVNSRLSAWKSDGAPRRAGVSSFGIGGTNAHVILEEAPPRPETSGGRERQLVVLSAKTGAALDVATARLAEYLRREPGADIADVAYTLQVGRRRFAHRRTLVCADAAAAAALEALDPRRVLTLSEERRDRPVAFVLPGQGAQYVNMARELYEREQSFRGRVDECAELLAPLLGEDVREHLFPVEGSAGEVSGRMDQTVITQPALFVVEYALARLWMDWGVRPRALIGHSLGEYVAACLSGVLSLEDALAVVAARARLMQSLPAGAMLAVPLAEDEVSLMLGGRLSLAAVNAPRLCVVSGERQAVEELAGRLAAEGVESRQLRTSHAFHSSSVESIEESFAAQLRKVKLRTPQIPFISNLTGTWIKEEEAIDPAYWVRHLRRTVRFADGLGELLRDEELALLEVGPGGLLGGLLGQYGEAGAGRVVLSSLRPRRGAEGSDVAHLLATLGGLWLAGVQVDWEGFHAGERRRREPLPTYPFERRRHWIDVRPGEGAALRDGQTQTVEKPDISRWFYAPVWKQDPHGELATLPAASSEGCWLIFLDDCGLGKRAAERLRGDGREVLTVRAGAEFEERSGGDFFINPARRSDYEALFSALRARGEEPSVILHLWGVTPAEGAGDAGAASGRAEAEDFYRLMHLAQALGDAGPRAPLSVCVVTNGVQRVTGEETLEPLKATALGAAHVIPLEYDNVTCRCADVTLPHGTDALDRLAARLVREAAAPAGDVVVAYRGDMRWTQVFEPLQVTATAERPAAAGEGGAYLFTNGVGEFELAFAEHLARGEGARLVLVADETFPVRDEWEKWLATHLKDEEVGRRIRQLEALEARGAEVLFVGADVTDVEQMRGVVAQARRRFGRIRGLFHSSPAAGGGGLLQLKTAQAAERVLAPRVRGALVLEEVLKEESPDFVVLFSATSAITGALGQADYCAANSFLDAFARARHSRLAPRVTSVSWGLQRQENWQERSLAGGARLQAQFRSRSEQYGMTTDEKVEALSLLLDLPLPHVVVSTEDFPALVREQRAMTAASLLQDLAGAEGGHLRPELKSAYIAPRDEVEEAVCAVWQEVFGVGRVGVDDNFFDLGGNSLVGIQLMSRLRKNFEIELPMNNLFESPTVAGLSQVIAAQRLRQSELEEVERTLREIEQLSLDEVQARLVAENPRGEGGLDGRH